MFGRFAAGSHDAAGSFLGTALLGFGTIMVAALVLWYQAGAEEQRDTERLQSAVVNTTRELDRQIRTITDHLGMARLVLAAELERSGQGEPPSRIATGRSAERALELIRAQVPDVTHAAYLVVGKRLGAAWDEWEVGAADPLAAETIAQGSVARNPDRGPYWIDSAGEGGGSGRALRAALPIDANGEYRAVAVLDIRPRYFAESLTAHGRLTGASSLVTRSGHWLLTAPGPHPPLDRLTGPPPGTVVTVAGSAYVAYPLGNAPWLLVSRVSGSDLRESVLGRMWTLFLVFGLAVLCIGLLMRQMRSTRLLIRKQKELEAVMRELVRTRDDAQAANRAKSSFLANVGHEIRTPLNAVIGFAELIPMMCGGAPKEAVLIEYSGHIKDAGDHLLHILNDLLDLARVEANRIDLHEATLDLSRLVDQCVNMVVRQASGAGVGVVARFDGSLPHLRADEVRMKQILTNLLTNAIKFTPVGGRVEVVARPIEGGGVRIVVSDTGIGMAPEDIPKALEPFGQIDNLLSRSFRGAGLGLALVRRLVELHGGELAIASAPGRGTSVTIDLPGWRIEKRAALPA